MIEMTFRKFYEYKYREDGFHELYVMRNGLDEILYVGISNQNIWNRWFGWNGHITDGPRYMVGESSVGEKIVSHLPESWDWKIQLWTLTDCVEFCKDEIGPNRKRYMIQMVEPFIIQKLRPSLNIIYNLNPGMDSTPKSQREIEREKLLDKVYRDVFENNSKWGKKKSS